jgi:hypothetical protein
LSPVPTRTPRAFPLKTLPDLLTSVRLHLHACIRTWPRTPGRHFFAGNSEVRSDQFTDSTQNEILLSCYQHLFAHLNKFARGRTACGSERMQRRAPRMFRQALSQEPTWLSSYINGGSGPVRAKCLFQLLANRARSRPTAVCLGLNRFHPRHHLFTPPFRTP